MSGRRFRRAAAAAALGLGAVLVALAALYGEDAPVWSIPLLAAAVLVLCELVSLSRGPAPDAAVERPAVTAVLVGAARRCAARVRRRDRGPPGGRCSRPTRPRHRAPRRGSRSGAVPPRRGARAAGRRGLKTNGRVRRDELWRDDAPLSYEAMRNQALAASLDETPGQECRCCAWRRGVSTLLCQRSDGRSTKRRIRSLDHACCALFHVEFVLLRFRTTATVPVRHRAGNVGDVAPVPWVETLGSGLVTTRMPGRCQAAGNSVRRAGFGRRYCERSPSMKISPRSRSRRMAAIADLMTSDSRAGPAIGLTWLPTVSHQAVYDALRTLTGAGLVRRIPTVRFRRWRHA